jgi:hypothetical protein
LRLVRTALAAGLALVAVVALAGPAYAAPPSNDTYAGRTVLASGSITQTVDTTEATTDADDAELGGLCDVPATDASVWYQATATADTLAVAKVTQSSYSARAIVATGSPGNWTVLGCWSYVSWWATAGETYTVLVVDDQLDGGGNGGELGVAISVAPPAIDVTVDPVGHFNATTGSATVSGTVTCSGTDDWPYVHVELRQAVGRVSTVRGTGYRVVTCDGSTQAWSIEVVPEYGKFTGGRATNVTYGEACRDMFVCAYDQEDVIIMLRP